MSNFDDVIDSSVWLSILGGNSRQEKEIYSRCKRIPDDFDLCNYIADKNSGDLEFIKHVNFSQNGYNNGTWKVKFNITHNMLGEFPDLPQCFYKMVDGRLVRDPKDAYIIIKNFRLKSNHPIAEVCMSYGDSIIDKFPASLGVTSCKGYDNINEFCRKIYGIDNNDIFPMGIFLIGIIHSYPRIYYSAIINIEFQNNVLFVSDPHTEISYDIYVLKKTVDKVAIINQTDVWIPIYQIQHTCEHCEITHPTRDIQIRLLFNHIITHIGIYCINFTYASDNVVISINGRSPNLRLTKKSLIGDDRDVHDDASVDVHRHKHMIYKFKQPFNFSAIDNIVICFQRNAIIMNDPENNICEFQIVANGINVFGDISTHANHLFGLYYSN